MRISDAATDKIANLLKVQGVLSENRLNLISAQFVKNKEKIVPELINKKFITEDDVAKVVSRSLGAKRFELNRKDVNINAFKLIPEKTIKEEQIIPFDVEGPVIKVAIADPTKVMTMAKINKVVEKNFLTIKDFWQNLDVPMIGMPEDSMLTAEFFHDTYYHLNSKGVKIRTKKLIDNLKPQLIKHAE